MNGLRIILITTIATCLNVLAPAQANSDGIAKVSTGTLDSYPAFKSNYVAARNVQVWLPHSYDGKKKHAVLYMHDGQMLFDDKTTWNGQEWGADEVAGRLIASGKTREFIIVGVFNGGTALRHSEYFPQKPFESLSPAEQKDAMGQKRDANTPLFSAPVQSDKYLKFLVEELKPFIDDKYAVHSDVNNTALLGSSMGGLISMYGISEYPQVFGSAACLSTHWPGIMVNNKAVPKAFFDYMAQNLPSPDTHRIYFDYGNKTLDQYYPPFQQQADDVMREKGFTNKNWVTNFFPGDEHAEDAWRARLHIPMTFLFGK